MTPPTDPPVPYVLRPRALPILERAIEEGVATGYRRAHKHEDNPPDHVVIDVIAEAVFSAILGVFE